MHGFGGVFVSHVFLKLLLVVVFKIFFPFPFPFCLFYPHLSIDELLNWTRLFPECRK